MNTSVPIKYTKEQYRNMFTMAFSGIRTIIPFTRPTGFPDLEKSHKRTLPAPSNSLVDQYIAWCGAPALRYANELPPHFCSHWALSLLSQIGASVPYNVLDILNQGAHITVNHPIPRGVPLYLSGKMISVVKEATRVRIHIRITTSTDKYTDAHILDSFLSVPLKTDKKLSKKKPFEPLPMNEIGTWTAGPSAGVDFARLTGDFNPIHVFSPLGRLAGFGGCILHGFGFMARSWEVCRNAGLDISDADLRFTKPLKLPTETLSVQISKTPDAQGRTQLNLKDTTGAIYLAGDFKCK